MSTTKKIPMRLCVGCKEMHDKRSLFRIVRSDANLVTLDYSHKMQGRGVYICKNSSCIEHAEKSKALQRALNAELPADFFENLYKQTEVNVRD